MQTPNDQESKPMAGHSVEKLDFNATDLGETAPDPNKSNSGKVKDPRTKGVEKRAVAQDEKAQAEKARAKAAKARVLARAKAAKAWALPRSLARNTRCTAKDLVESLLFFCSPFLNPHTK